MQNTCMQDIKEKRSSMNHFVKHLNINFTIIEAWYMQEFHKN